MLDSDPLSPREGEGRGLPGKRSRILGCACNNPSNIALLTCIQFFHKLVRDISPTALNP